MLFPINGHRSLFHRHIMFVCIGFLLMAAALLKGVGLVSGSIVDFYDLSLFMAGPFLVCVELFLGSWIAFGLYQSAARIVAICVFVCFFIANAFQIIAGEANCGCFGPVNVIPWITLVLDVILIAMLLHHRLSDCAVATIRTHPVRLFSQSLVFLMLLGLLGVARQYRAEALNLVVFDPEISIGSRIPFLADINVSEDLTKGDWLLVFYRTQCRQCQKEIELQRAAAKLKKQRLMVIRVLPDYSEFGHLSFGESGIREGVFDPRDRWAMQTPLVVHLHDGKIQSD